MIGINNPSGLLSIGDALYTGAAKVQFKGIPSFSPEVFAYVSNPNPSKYKNYRKGLRWDDERLTNAPSSKHHIQGAKTGIRARK